MSEMDGRCSCGAYTDSSSGLCADCAGRSRIYNSSGFVGFADEVRRGACDCGKVECLICGRDEQRIIADLRAKLAEAWEQVSTLS